MSKGNVYKNVNEYIKITFPNVYSNKKIIDEDSLENILKNNSDNFKIKINDILKSEKTKRRITNGNCSPP